MCCINIYMLDSRLAVTAGRVPTAPIEARQVGVVIWEHIMAQNEHKTGKKVSKGV
jgi:hypothetical protein